VLCQTIHNSLLHRRQKYDYPSVDIIKQYILGASLIKVVGEFVKYEESVTKHLSKIEQDIFSYLNNRKYAFAEDLRSHLRLKGHGLALVRKNTYTSPLVYIDKSGGKQHYKYSFPGAICEGNRDTKQKNEFYYKIRRRLQVIKGKGTDEAKESKRRREQSALADWLFKNKKTECCAICQRRFNILSLITAHKKKRSLCSESERLDPYIVMPLCRFGCDYLYEVSCVSIVDGKVQVIFKNADGFEKTILKSLDGQKIADKWLKGSKSYFEKFDL